MLNRNKNYEVNGETDSSISLPIKAGCPNLNEFEKCPYCDNCFIARCNLTFLSLGT